MDTLSFLQSISGFTQAQTSQQSENKPFKLGTIDSAYVATSFPGTLPKVTFDGESTLSGKLYPVMSPYWPQPSDRVVLAPVGNTYLILGPVTSTSSSAYLGNDLSVADDITLASGSVATWAGDTNLYRSAADTLKTDDSLVVGGSLSIGSNVLADGATGTVLTAGTTEAVARVLTSQTYKNGKAYKLELQCQANSSVVNSVVFRLRKGTTTGDTLLIDNGRTPMPIAASDVNAVWTCVFRNISGSDVTTQLAVTALASTGTCALRGFGSGPFSVIIYELPGPASAYANHPTIS